MGELFTDLGDSLTLSLPPLRNILLCLLLAFVLSKPLAWVYVHTHRGASYSRSTAQALILLCLIVTLVMLAIGDSLARAFGLFGALALIRFRTPVKDTRDTVFLFLAVATGIAVGSQNLLLAVVGSTFALAVAAYLDWTRFGQRLSGDGVLRLSVPVAAAGDLELRAVLQRSCRSFALMQARDGIEEGHLELAYQLDLRDPERSPQLVADLRNLAGAREVSIVMQTEHEEL